MTIVELVLDEDAEVRGIDAISLVEHPAIMMDFVALADEHPMTFAQVSDQQLLVGPALVPDKPIYRKRGDQEFYVYFSKTTVRKAAELFMRDENLKRWTLEHDQPIHGVQVVESWVVEDPAKDKAAFYGLSVPPGTWMVSVKVDNESIWNDWVKTGSVRGFSIEGYFVDRLEMSKEDRLLEELRQALVDGDEVHLESFNDYPDSVRNNAKRGIKLNEKHDNKCATPTGKIRAQQLANGRPISVETIKRMYSYLSRAEEDYDPSDTSACGTISYLLWGGKSALGWSRNKLRKLGELEE
jgi:hypothetical protein